MKSILFSTVFLSFICFSAMGQNQTDASLFMRSDSLQTNMIQDESGDIYRAIGHHGPAVENEWLALRLYFNNRATSIDAYNKQKKGLELKKALWYPTEKEQKKGLGADYYKVGSTVGLGGVRLWDGEKEVMLAPVSNRIVQVKKEGNFSQMEMISKDVPYKGKKIDVMVRVTAYSGLREMRVEAFAFSEEDVQFVTGINYFDSQKVLKEEDRIITWGLHPEDVAAESVQVGAAIVINHDDFEKTVDDGKQHLFVSKPCKYISSWVTSTIEKDKKLGTLEKFKAYVSEL
ncbi:DUF4861 family protein [Carboxylicivirga linearis]|uniref:DUF4861 family protein n=1 Tax=Carboxylicivirga linearis TaxID=1628157 RepID=A0ABS5JRI1_9BACT|nr:DUF4861 family protein [Carboxylicivirga linearis]MBS2097407.1 DUF4861 family protein [Carboxylicivirga linearis]